MLHDNGCDDIMKGKNIRDFERQLSEHNKVHHPKEFYMMDENNKQELNEIIKIIIMN